MDPKVRILFRELADLSQAERSRVLEERGIEPQVRAELESLLKFEATSTQQITSRVAAVADEMLRSGHAGARHNCGPYRLVRMIGSGGMGSVYLAERSDGEIEQRVAVKLLRDDFRSSEWQERFLRERQLLARLHHTSIVHLIDAGHTVDGRPYLVMEYVDGVPIDVFGGALEMRGRLILFLRVCAGVSHAHQHLIVHRDLKPVNILVTADGQPKLLDFGIAKVLDPREASTAGTRMLTPEYASPEQVRGDPISTASDIYSLGAVLCRLLTGRPPHSLEGMSPLEAARTIAESEPRGMLEVPSDLRAILRKALHSDPNRRYPSVQDLARDIERYLDRLPVLAVPDSYGYRAGKFLRRNWVAVAAVAAVISAISVGGGIALWQARRAEQRFDEVRKLANTFLFDFESAIHNVSGATKARLLVVKTAEEYLARLARDAGGDQVLTRELADSYQKLADVQGGGLGAGGNVGQISAALNSYRKGLALRESIGDRNTSDPKARLGFLLNLNALAGLEWASGDRETAARLSSDAAQLADRWVPQGAADAELLAAASNTYRLVGDIQRYQEDHKASAVSYQRQLDLQTRAYELQPSDPVRLIGMASAYRGLGFSNLDGGKPAAAIADFKQGTRFLDQALATDPKNVSVRWALMKLAGDTGDAILRLKPKDPATDPLPFLQRAYRTGNDLLAEDPANELVQADLARICQLYGSTLQLAGKAAEALPLLERGIVIYSRELDKLPGDANAAFNLAIVCVWTSDCRRDLHDLPGAIRESKMAAELWDHLLAQRPGTFRYLHQKADNLNTLGNLLAAQGDITGAKTCFREGLAIAEKLPQLDTGFSTAVLFKELRESQAKLPR